MINIKFCEENFTHGTDVIANRLKEQHKNVEVEIEPCLGYCGECAIGPFALVDDELIEDETAEGLYEKINELL